MFQGPTLWPSAALIRSLMGSTLWPTCRWRLACMTFRSGGTARRYLVSVWGLTTWGFKALTVYLKITCCVFFCYLVKVLPESGIHCGNEDSCRNENRNSGKNIFSVKKKSTSILFFFAMKIMMMDVWMQIEGTKLKFVMNFIVLLFFKFASRMPQIAQILVLTFKIFWGEGGGRVVGGMPPDLPRNFLFFSISNSRLCLQI